ncbi:hypothetical protein SDC9_142505 [bioreactor metagenome]|uniref:Uncharacterized protein n=1 Tax=bioreactor metagenome TaxID=1076179 RepID=A0A645E1C2_9ZZZZ
MNHHRIAIGHAACAGAHIAHGDGLVAVDQQRDFGRQREHPRDLPQHARGIDHRRARLHACNLPTVDHHAAGIRVSRVINHLRGHAGRLDAVAQLQQLAQLGVLLQQQLDLIGLLRHGSHSGLGLVAALLRIFQRLEVARAAAGELHRLEHQPLNGHEHRANALAHRLGDVKTRIRHHQKQRQGAVEGQSSEGRRTLLEKRWRLAIKRA